MFIEKKIGIYVIYVDIKHLLSHVIIKDLSPAPVRAWGTRKLQVISKLFKKIITSKKKTPHHSFGMFDCVIVDGKKWQTIKPDAGKLYLPLLTLRPRLLFSFSGSTMLRCFMGNALEFASYPLAGTEKVSKQLWRKSLLSNKSPPPLSGVSAARKRPKYLKFQTERHTGPSKNSGMPKEAAHQQAPAVRISELDHSSLCNNYPNQIC